MHSYHHNGASALLRQEQQADVVAHKTQQFMWAYDTESYPNFYCVIFKNLTTGEMKEFSYYGEDIKIDAEAIASHVQGLVLVSYNGLGYDDLLLVGVTTGVLKTPQQVYAANDSLTNESKGRESLWQKKRRFAEYLQLEKLKTIWQSIDLLQIKASDIDDKPDARLKVLGLRLCAPNIQNLPCAPGTRLTGEEAEQVARYCRNEIALLELLYKNAAKEIELREVLAAHYGFPDPSEIINASDPKICEKVILHEYCRRMHLTPQQLAEVIGKNRKSAPEFICLGNLIDKELETMAPPELCRIIQQIKNKRLKKEKDGTRYQGDLRLRISLGKRTFVLGWGGLHSEDTDRGIWRRDNDFAIIHMDVASYYPAIMLKLKIHPQHLDPVVLDILREIRDRRLQVKDKPGQESIAAALKIILLSYFGKSGSAYSDLYQAENMFRVTINGELYLLMLIFQLQQAGFEIITANTDGLVVKVPNTQKEACHEICQNWSRNLEFSIDYEELDAFLRLNVNEYVLVKDGKISTAKGSRFINAHSAQVSGSKIVVAQAVLNRLVYNKPVAETLAECQDPFDFCMVSSLGKAKDGEQRHFFLDGEQIGTEARWIRVRNAKNQLYTGTTPDRQTKCKEGQNIKIVNDIGDFCRDELDLEWYAGEADEIIRLFSTGGEKIRPERKTSAPARKDLPPFPPVVDALDRMGLVLVPTTSAGDHRNKYKAKPVGWRDFYPNAAYTRHWDWSSRGYTGVAVMTGAETRTVSIDLDNPELARESLKSFLPLQTMASGHGVDLESVRHSQARGAAIFKIPEAAAATIKSTDGKFLKKHGFEVIYDGKSQKVGGKHADGTHYAYDGAPVDIPPSLLDYLHNLTGPLPQNKIFTRQSGDGLRPLTRESYDIRAIEAQEPVPVDAVISHVLPQWKFRKIAVEISVDGAEKPQLVVKRQGRCPYAKRHSTGNNDRDFAIYWDFAGDRIVAMCRHESCQQEVAQLWKKLDLQVSQVLQQQAKERQRQAESAKQQEEAQKELSQNKARDLPDLAQAFRKAMESPEKVSFIRAATGSGKTTQAAIEFVNLVKQNKRAIFVANQKRDMSQFYGIVKKMFTAQELQKVTVISSETGGHCNADTVGVITHHTYFSRKGHSSLHYATILWIEGKNATVFVDEAQAYVENQLFWLYAGGRYRTQGHTDHAVPSIQSVNRCLAHAKYGNCQECSLCEQSYMYANEHGILECRPWTPGKIGNCYKSFQFPPLAVKQDAIYRTLKIAELVMASHDHLAGRKFRCNRSPDETSETPEEFIQDLLRCSLQPMRYVATPVRRLSGGGTKEIDPQQIPLGPGKSTEYEFPCAACQVPVYCFHDRSAAHFLCTRAAKVIFMGATLSADNMRFLESCANVKKIDVAVPPERKLHEVAIVLFKKNLDIVRGTVTKEITLQPIMDQLEGEEKILIFMPTKKEAQSLFYKVSPDERVRLLFSRYSYPTDATEDLPCWVAITYSLGPLGKSVNRPYDMVCIIDAGIFLPRIAYKPGTEITKEMIERAYIEKAMDIIIQNIGRILRLHPTRPDKRKVIIIHNTGDIQVTVLFTISETFFSISCKSSWKVEENQDYLIAGVAQYMKQGEFLSVSEQEFTLEGLKKEIRQQWQTNSHLRWRDVVIGTWSVRNADPEIKKQLQDWFTSNKPDKLVEKIKAYLAENQSVNRSELYRKFHIDRLGKKRLEKLKQQIGPQWIAT